ncbi:MAG: molybdopterin oxidoreductase [SAR324 cluster bacterium]|nr:molybdopterin oxidoreductase [SAR324 cluster bacterium]
MKEIAEKSLFNIPENLKRFLWALVIIGAGMFIAGLTTGGEDSVIRTWQAFLINTVFWAGIAHAGILFSVIWQLTDAKWGRPFKRLSEACAAFLPISFLMFVIVIFGSKVLFEWTHTPFLHHGVAVKAGWLNLPFFVSRNIAWLVIIYAVSWWFVKTSIKPDIALARKLLGSDWGGAFADKVLNGYGEHEDEVIRLEKLSRKLAPALAILYAFGASFLAWDFVMTLDQEWFSTLFGVFFIIGNMHAFMGLMLAISVTVRNKFGMQEYITLNRLHDLAKMVFAFSLLWAYMGYTQYLVIWYADMPEETPYLVIRSMEQPWALMFLLIIIGVFAIPFIGLLPKTLCRVPNYIRVMGIWVAVWQWFVIYLMVVPSLQHYGHYHVYLGMHELLITLGFAGLFFLSYLTFLGKVPILPISDKHLCRSWHGH